jgi:8-oxo-dGTP diphosphatase
MASIKVVCGIIFDNEEVFICRRKQGKSLAGYWEFPGGKIEENESDVNALERELFEELEMKVVVKEFIGQSNYDYDNFQIQLYGYECQLINFTGKLTDHDKFQWVDKLKLKEFNLAPADIPFVRMIENKHKK